jgi:hypothetical protein
LVVCGRTGRNVFFSRKWRVHPLLLQAACDIEVKFAGGDLQRAPAYIHLEMLNSQLRVTDQS